MVGIPPPTMRSPMNLDALFSHTNWVRMLSMDLLGDAHQADDVVQETLLSALRHPETRDWSGNRVRAWLGQVARNFAVMAMRGESRRRAREEAHAVPESQPSAAESLEMLELQREIAAAVMALGSPDREIVVLRYFDDLPPREIARNLGLSPSAVHSRLHRARATLREKLDRPHGSTGGSWVVAAIGWAKRPAGAPFRPGIELGALQGAAVGGLIMKTIATLAVVLALVLALFVGRRWFAPASGEGPEARRLAEAELVQPTAPPERTEPVLVEPEVKLDGNRVALAEEPEETLEAELAPPTTGTVRVSVVRADDGLPAAGIGLLVHPWSPDTWFHGRRGTTDEEGVARFELPPGKVGVYIQRLSEPSTFGAESAVVVAGEIHEVTFEVVPGDTIRGRVIDYQGRAVVGAEVWLGKGGPPCEGQVVTRSGMDGSFEIRHTSRAQGIAARAPGHAPSLAVLPLFHGVVEDEHGETDVFYVELVLPDVGGTMEGSVVDQDGRPLADALVLVGNGKFGHTVQLDGQPAYDPPPVRLRTGATGRFRVEGVQAGPVRVRARALGLDQAEQTVEVPRGGVGVARLVLQPAASVAGIVRRADGRPVAGARVELADSVGGLDRTHAITDAEGRFRLTGLPVGLQGLKAELEEERLAIRTEIRTSPGVEEWWEATFPDSRTLAGSLVDGNGTPLAGWSVARETEGAASGQGEMNRARKITDDDGRFRFDACPPRAQTLSVRPPGQLFSEGVAELEGVLPGEEEVTLRVASEDVPRGELRGMLLDAQGNPVPGAEVQLSAMEPVFVHLIVTGERNGSFTIPYLPASRYDLSISAEGFEVHVKDDIETLEAGELHDLGTLVLEPSESGR